MKTRPVVANLAMISFALRVNYVQLHDGTIDLAVLQNPFNSKCNRDSVRMFWLPNVVVGITAGR